jgi:hypothetical protein
MISQDEAKTMHRKSLPGAGVLSFRQKINTQQTDTVETENPIKYYRLFLRNNTLLRDLISLN